MFFRAGWNRTTLPFAVGLAAVTAAVGLVGGPVATIVGAAVVAGGVIALSAAVHRWDMGAARLLSGAIERMTAGDFTARVRLRGEDKLGECGFRLNLLAERTGEQIGLLERQRTDLAALVDALPDAVLLADASRRVVGTNAPAAAFLGVSVKQAKGQPLIALLGEATLVEMYEQCLAAPNTGERATPVVREVRVTRQGQRLTYQAVAARTAAGGVVMALRDVTELAAAMRMKADFVANASHELRTPIAAIKIAFETLADVIGDDPEQTQRCQTIIAGHLRRLEEMLQDLLDLSRVEDAEAKPDLAAVDPAALLETVDLTMRPLAKGKDLALELSATAGAFTSDRKLLDLVLKNLVENAIKYTPAGGRVAVTIGNDADGATTLTVADSGIGIPPQHAERVFERFYQVDPARSGSVGRGTGLGLAIVKHAIAALGGTVTLDSTVGRGTRLVCRLPGEK